MASAVFCIQPTLIKEKFKCLHESFQTITKETGTSASCYFYVDCRPLYIHSDRDNSTQPQNLTRPDGRQSQALVYGSWFMVLFMVWLMVLFMVWFMVWFMVHGSQFMVSFIMFFLNMVDYPLFFPLRSTLTLDTIVTLCDT